MQSESEADGRDLFSSARFSIRHAKRHIETVARLVQAYIESDPYGVFVKPDPLYPGYKIQYLLLTKPMPEEVSGYASDAIQNLRSALDQIGFALATAADRSGKRAMFPFGETAEEAAGRWRQNSGQIPRELFDLMLSFQPYKGGNNALWALNKLANVKKHETVVYASLRLKTLTYVYEGLTLATEPGPEATDTYVPIAWLAPNTPHREYKLEVETLIRFAATVDIPELDKPAVGLLNTMTSVCQGILAAVEAEARRTRLIV